MREVKEMAVKEITLTLPEELYRDARKAGILSSEYIESLLRDACGSPPCSVTWEDRIEEIQREIQRAGGVDKTKEEIIAELRSTRKRLWEAEYSR
jgi:post-segregation antitoxin (ccd killing protein)